MADPTRVESIQELSEEGESIWIRGLYMLLFVLIYGVAEVVVVAVACIQFGWVVVTEERNPRIERFGTSLSAFVYQLVRFWTFVSDDKPFPFGDWPPSESREEGGQDA